MNLPEHELAARIVRHLDEGANRIGPDTSARLLAARRAALSRYRDRPVAVSGLAWAGRVMARFSEGPVDARYLVALALAAVLAGVVYWQGNGKGNDLADIDTALLTGELPLNAYLDKGFDSWLKRSLR
jgi:hypothetical protein